MIDIYSQLKKICSATDKNKTASNNLWLKRSGLNLLSLNIGDIIKYSDNEYEVISIESSQSITNIKYGLKPHSFSSNSKIFLLSDVLYKDQLNRYSKELKSQTDLIDMGKQVYREYFDSSLSRCSVSDIADILTELDHTTKQITRATQEYQETHKISSFEQAYSDCLGYILNGIESSLNKQGLEFNIRAGGWVKATQRRVQQLEKTAGFEIGDRVVSINYGVCGTVIDKAPSDRGGTEHDIDLVVNWDEPINGYSLFEVHPTEIRKFGDDEIKTKDLGKVEDVQIFVVDPKNLQSSLEDIKWNSIKSASYLTSGMHYIPNNEIWVSPKVFTQNELSKVVAQELAIIHYMKQGVEHSMASRMASLSINDWVNRYFKPKASEVKDEINCEECKTNMLWEGESESWRCPGCKKTKELIKRSNSLEGSVIAFNKNYNGSTFIKKGTLALVHSIEETSAVIDLLTEGGSRITIANFKNYVEELKDTDLLKELKLDNIF